MEKTKLTAAFLIASSLALGACSNENSAPVDIQEKASHWSTIYQKVADGATTTELSILSDRHFGSYARHFTQIEDCRLKYLGETAIKTDFDTAKQVTLCSVEKTREAAREELRSLLGTGFAVGAGLIGAVTALHLYSRRRSKPLLPVR